MSKRNEANLLHDILEAVEKILRYTDGMSYEDFHLNEVVMDAVLRNFTIIGEASNNLGENFFDRFPNVEWRLIINFRHRIVHHYFGIDTEVVWEIVVDELPKLRRKISEIIEDIVP